MDPRPRSSTLFPYTTLFRSLVFDLTGTAFSDRRVAIEASWTAPLGVICALDQIPTRCRWRDLENVPFVLFPQGSRIDRKSTRLNSSHVSISYAVFCLKQKIT